MADSHGHIVSGTLFDVITTEEQFTSGPVLDSSSKTELLSTSSSELRRALSFGKVPPNKTYALAVELGVPPSAIKIFEENHPKNCERVRDECLEYIVNNSNIQSWDVITETVRHINLIVGSESKCPQADRTQDSHVISATPPDVGGDLSTDERQSTSGTVQEIIKSKTVVSSANVESLSEKERCEEAIEIDRQNLLNIKSEFGELLVIVRKALQAKELDIRDIQMYLSTIFDLSSDVFPEESNLHRTFGIVGDRKLWNFDHYTAVEKLILKLILNNAEVKSAISQYKASFSGYLATTKISDHMTAMENLPFDSDSDGEDSMPKHDKKYYRKLTVKLKLKVKVTEQTMDYIYKLWRSIADFYQLPSLSAVLDSIVDGSLVITWLIPAHWIHGIAEHSYTPQDVKLLSQLQIKSIKVDSHIIYNCKDQLLEMSGTGILEAVRSLIDLGVDVNNTNQDGQTALMGACGSGHLDIVKLLIEHGAQINLVHENGWTALLWACAYGHLDIVELLIEHRAQVDLADQNGRTALIWAFEEGHLDVVKLLIERGAQADITEEYGDTALMKCCRNGHLDIVKLLIEHGAQVNLADRDGQTALMWACQHGHLDIVKLLFEYGAQVNLAQPDGWNAVMEVCVYGHPDILKLLIEHGAQVDSIHAKYGFTGLVWACVRGQLETVKLLIEYGANVDIIDNNGLTALMYASKDRNSDIVLMVIGGRLRGYIDTDSIEIAKIE